MDVLVLCAAAGLIVGTLGSIAIDGTKMGADAALDANRSVAAVRAEVERIVAEARGIDQADDARLGSARGDELPVELASPLSRLARLERALAELAEVEGAAQARAARAAEQMAAAAGQGRKPLGRPPSDPHQALARAEANLAAVKARMSAKAARRAGHRARPATQGRKPKGPEPGAAWPWPGPSGGWLRPGRRLERRARPRPAR